MEKGSNEAFKNIVNGIEYDDRLPRALDMFDDESRTFYKDFDEIIEQVETSGTADKRPSLVKKSYALELVINEILHQEYGFDEKATEVCGVIRADVTDLSRYVCQKAGVPFNEEVKEPIQALDELFKGHMYELKNFGADIPTLITRMYMTVSKAMLDETLNDAAERFYRNHQ